MSQAQSDSAARRAFHWCLAGVFLPVVSVPIELLAVLHHLRREDATDEDLRWARRLFALAMVDLLLTGLLIAYVVSGLGTPKAQKTSPPEVDPPKARIGVFFRVLGSLFVLTIKTSAR